MVQKTDVTLDLTGLTCPAPLLGAKKVFDDLKAGQTLCLISNCSGTRDDLTAWCAATGHILVSATARDDGSVAYLLQKTAPPESRPAPHATLDMRGVACPGPIVEAKRLLLGMKSGEILQLVTDCTAAIDDIPLWSRETGIELLMTLPESAGAHSFFLKKA
jgi:tRNA 2-thiouridine synthesizing protein A